MFIKRHKLAEMLLCDRVLNYHGNKAFLLLVIRAQFRLLNKCLPTGINHSHSQGSISSLTLAEPPKGFPQSLYQRKLQIDHHINYGLRKKNTAIMFHRSTNNE